MLRKGKSFYFILSSCLMLLQLVECANSDRKPKILNRREDEQFGSFDQYSQQPNATDASIDDVIEEIIDSNRQGRNIEGLDEVYNDPTVMQALTSGDDSQARNLIRDKLCDIGLMECEKPRPIYHQRPPQYNVPLNRPPPPFKQIGNNGIYGPPRPVPVPNVNAGPPRKVGFSSPPSQNQYNFQPSRPAAEKFGTEFHEYDRTPATIKFGYTEKPVINVVNQGKREASAPTQNTHIHHHYVHVDGTTGVEGTKAGVIVNTPISEYSAVPQISGSYNGLNNYNSYAQNSQEYESPAQGIFGLSSNVKPIYEGYNNNQQQQQQQYQKQQQISAGNNGGYSSFHASQPDAYKKELNLNGNRQNNYYTNQQQQQGYSDKYNKYSQNYNNNQNGFDDCTCVPFDQCPAQEIVGRRDDLILPIDPRNLPVDIEAEHENSTSSTEHLTNETPKNSTSEHKISKRDTESRLLGGQSSYGGYPGNGGVGKKIIPTLGVSFGLPVPNYNYPILPNGHIPNPHFGALNANGLSLGLVNVNPLFSLQVTKSEHGEKLVKPFVNLHVTPNKGIVDVIGGLFAAKKQHLHKHLHLHRYPPHPPHFPPHFIDNGPPEFIGPHLPPPPPHFEGPFHQPPPPHHFENHPPPHFEGPSGPPGPPGLPPFLPYNPEFLHRSNNEFENDKIPRPNQVFNDQYPPISFRSNNASSFDANNLRNLNQNEQQPFNYQKIYPEESFKNLNSNGKNDFRYARQFENNENFLEYVQPIPAQAPGSSEGSDKVSFPTSRRRRDTDQVVPDSIDEKSTEENSEQRASKRQAYNSLPKQCGPKAVCCRRPNKFVQNPYQPNNQYNAPNNHYNTPNHGNSRTNQCGLKNAGGVQRIKNPSYVDGDSEFGEYPWQVAILKKDPKESVYVCGGTLIDESHILTAAHCIKTYKGFDLRVRLGEWDVNHDVEFFPYVERDIISVHVHPEYYAGTLDNDIAVLKMNQPIDLVNNPHINSACLPDKYSDFNRQRCWTTGWGKDNWEFGKYQNILKEVDVPIIDHNTCQNQLRQTRLGYSYNLNPGFICAGGEEGKDACRGDGGGPLVCESNGVWQLAGIVSWGIGCGKVNVPGVYVKVSHYLDWIHQITQRY